MSRTALVVAVVVVLTAGSGRAATLPLIEGVPATYTPGESFTFGVRAPGLPDFREFSVEFAFSTEVIDPDLAVTAAPDPAQYPFASTAGFQSAYSAPPGGSEVGLTISDSVTTGVFTTPGSADLLALVTVNPGPGMEGSITIRVENAVLKFNAEGRPRDSLPDPVTVDQAAGGGGGTPVPAPAGVVLLAVAGAVLTARNRLHRAA